MAAVGQRIRVTSVGVFFAIFIPGAYVRIDQNLSYLTPLQQLRVYCGGIWHNLVMFCFNFSLFNGGYPLFGLRNPLTCNIVQILCGVASLTLSTLPVLLSPMYAQGNGATIISIADGSPFSGHLHTGTTITCTHSGLAETNATVFVN